MEATRTFKETNTMRIISSSFAVVSPFEHAASLAVSVLNMDYKVPVKCLLTLQIRVSEVFKVFSDTRSS